MIPSRSKATRALHLAISFDACATQPLAWSISDICSVALEQGIGRLTLFINNASKNTQNVEAIVQMVEWVCGQHNLYTEIIGVVPDWATEISCLPKSTNTGDGNAAAQELHVAIAFDYDQRAELLALFNKKRSTGSPEFPCTTSDDELTAWIADRMMPDIDYFLVLGGHEKFGVNATWSAAYSEFVFESDILSSLPGARLDSALEMLKNRRRRFGGIENLNPNGP